MDNKKIASFIKKKRKEKNMTQAELAEKLYVTEKAISRWETGRGTPDVSLLVPLSEALDVSVSEILNGEKKDNKKKVKEEAQVNDLIKYIEINKKGKYNIPFIFSIICYVVSIIIFLLYLKMDYNVTIDKYYDSNFNSYLTKGILLIISSILIIIGNYIFSNNYIDKVKDKEKIKTFSNLIIFIYYAIFIFNIMIFARYEIYYRINLIPFKTIKEIITFGTQYSIVVNILGNLLVFMPLSYFLIELFKIKGYFKNIIISIMSLLILELVQYIFNLGVFDIDDIILPVIGISIFYFIYNKIKVSNKKIIYMISVPIILIVLICFILNCGDIKLNMNYDEEIMSCHFKNNTLIYEVDSSVLDFKREEKVINDKEIIVFVNQKLKVSNIARYKWELKENQKQNRRVFGMIDEKDYEEDKRIKVYYTKVPFYQIAKASNEELEEIINKSIYMCSNNTNKSSR